MPGNCPLDSLVGSVQLNDVVAFHKNLQEWMLIGAALVSVSLNILVGVVP